MKNKIIIINFILSFIWCVARCFILKPINPEPYVLPVSSLYLSFSGAFLGGLIGEKLGIKQVVNISQLVTVVLYILFLLGVTVI